MSCAGPVGGHICNLTEFREANTPGDKRITAVTAVTLRRAAVNSCTIMYNSLIVTRNHNYDPSMVGTVAVSLMSMGTILAEENSLCLCRNEGGMHPAGAGRRVLKLTGSSEASTPADRRFSTITAVALFGSSATLLLMQHRQHQK